MRSETLKNAKINLGKNANIIVKEDKIHRISDLVRKLGIKSNDKIQLLKRYVSYTESKGYAHGVEDGENGIKEDFRILFGIENKEEEL